MKCNPCNMIECSEFYAVWPKASRLNAVESMQRGPMHPDWMQWIVCSMVQVSRLNAVDSMHCDWMQCTQYSVEKCIPIECSGFHAAWLNAVYSMQREEMEPDWMQWILFSMIECSGFHAANWMQCILCSMAQSIPIERSGFHAFWVYEM